MDMDYLFAGSFSYTFSLLTYKYVHIITVLHLRYIFLFHVLLNILLHLLNCDSLASALMLHLAAGQ